MERESFRSRLGFLLVSAGCAIGIGNVWRFPYIAGKNGGGYFVLFYLICLLVMGVPVLTMELAVGRASRQSAVLAYKTLEKPGSKWHIHGWFAIIGCYLLMMYYTTVSGWMLNYFVKFATGVFTHGMEAEASAQVFFDMLANPTEMGLWMAVTVIAGVVICSVGVQKGLERVSKVMMCALLVLILVLAIHSFTLSGAKEGISFYLVPNWENVRAVGLGNVIAAAMNQSFFTLSLPRLLQLRRRGDLRPQPDLCHPAQRIHQHGRRPHMGYAVLPVYDLRLLLHGHRRHREHHVLVHGSVRLEPEEGRTHQRCAHPHR